MKFKKSKTMTQTSLSSNFFLLKQSTSIQIQKNIAKSARHKKNNPTPPKNQSIALTA
jgi:hypothetical protein